jgi:valyl-tRNA synthetase
MIELDKSYSPKDSEKEIYSLWEKSGAFKPEINPDGEPYCIIMPPPNSNGALHLGHAVFVTLEDIMIRFARMQGKAALWLPGADHAGFETQVVFEKKLEKEGLSRFKMDPDELYRRMLDFTQENKKRMESQLKELGASCDWDREKFTLDKDIIKIVNETFVKLYEDGLVYRDLRPVNWCTKHQTSLSDLEVKYEEQSDPLYYIKYGPLTLATVRPETKFGDTAVAVNPTDKRYQKYIGQEIEIETVLGKSKIKVVADEIVDPKFGTGVVKITPAHDPNDFEAGRRHNLEVREVIDKYGRMNEKAGPFEGMKIKEAREKVVEAMQQKGLIDKIDDKYVHTVGKCYKCGTVIEPRVMNQWFIAVNKKGDKSGKCLAEDAVKAVKSGKVKFVSKKFEKIFFHWLKNIRDWNISRQIVWGIKIPVWYKGDEVKVGTDSPGEGWVQEKDVFDTWFSSGQWPFATLQTTGDFEKFYPTAVMETGWDILFFWVARMIMLGLYVTGDVPFKQVYLHGLVRDKDRQKMSKSKGNVIDPLGVAELYGTDAVRMALVFGVTAGSDIVISEEKIRGMRNFSNKIWNISRFILMNLGEGDLKDPKFSPKDQKDLARLDEVIKESTEYLNNLQFSRAGELLYEFVWHEFADIMIEEAKPRLQSDLVEDCTAARAKLVLILTSSLKMLHPFVPFVTETIWQKLPNQFKDSENLISATWPTK